MKPATLLWLGHETSELYLSGPSRPRERDFSRRRLGTTRKPDGSPRWHQRNGKPQ